MVWDCFSREIGEIGLPFLSFLAQNPHNRKNNGHGRHKHATNQGQHRTQHGQKDTTHDRNLRTSTVHEKRITHTLEHNYIPPRLESKTAKGKCTRDKNTMKCFTMKYAFFLIAIFLQQSKANTITQQTYTSRVLASSEEDESTSPKPAHAIAKNCKPKPDSQCERCNGGKRSGREGCEETGKRQLFLCESAADEDDDSEVESEVESTSFEVYKSCNRTRVDEDYLMMRLQGVCALVSFLALRSVRREKVRSESLFDQRKRIARQQQQEQKQQEMIPLTAESDHSDQGDLEIGRITSDDSIPGPSGSGDRP